MYTEVVIEKKCNICCHFIPFVSFVNAQNKVKSVLKSFTGTDQKHTK